MKTFGDLDQTRRSFYERAIRKYGGFIADYTLNGGLAVAMPVDPVQYRALLGLLESIPLVVGKINYVPIESDKIPESQRHPGNFFKVVHFDPRTDA